MRSRRAWFLWCPARRRSPTSSATSTRWRHRGYRAARVPASRMCSSATARSHRAAADDLAPHRGPGIHQRRSTWTTTRSSRRAGACAPASSCRRAKATVSLNAHGGACRHPRCQTGGSRGGLAPPPGGRELGPGHEQAPWPPARGHSGEVRSPMAPRPRPGRGPPPRAPRCGGWTSCSAGSFAGSRPGLLSTGENAGERWHTVVCVDK
jgi:hypothetical protein